VPPITCLDLGPAAGVTADASSPSGTPQEMASPDPPRPGAISGRLRIMIPTERRTSERFLAIKGARANNLRLIDVQIPLGVLTCVTGVSGSGKSTLVIDTLFRALGPTPLPQQGKSRTGQGNHRARTPRQGHRHRSVPHRPHAAQQSRHLHRGLHRHPRSLRAAARSQNARLQTGRFSFNVKGGRCEACQGDGILKIEMHFLPDVYVTCEVCKAGALQSRNPGDQIQGEKHRRGARP
jgi:excinuclease ABC subunit A